MKNLSNERIGTIGKNNFGSVMEVIEYNNYSDILVQFDQGKPIRAEWGQFLKGNIRNVYDKTVLGVGYIGEGTYKTKIHGTHTPQYKTWHHMLVRGYSEKYQKRFPTYEFVRVDSLWHNFHNFVTWYDENYYEIEGERMELDKDILIKGNKVYNPDTCVFVSQSINSLFTKRDASRGDLPIGVHWNKRKQKYVAQCMDGKGNKKGLGHHNTPLEAFNTYKLYKEKLIKQIAEEYNDKIPLKLYNAMLNYIVEITD